MIVWSSVFFRLFHGPWTTVGHWDPTGFLVIMSINNFCFCSFMIDLRATRNCCSSVITWFVILFFTSLCTWHLSVNGDLASAVRKLPGVEKLTYEYLRIYSSAIKSFFDSPMVPYFSRFFYSIHKKNSTAAEWVDKFMYRYIHRWSVIGRMKKKDWMLKVKHHDFLLFLAIKYKSFLIICGYTNRIQESVHQFSPAHV